MGYKSPAAQRYLRRFFPTMIAYVVALFGANYAIHMYQPTGLALVALSILPALPVIAIIGVMGLYLLEENDEYVRQRIATSMLAGLAIMLAVATTWGFLEESDVVPHVPAYWAFVIWCAAWGASQCVLGLADRLRKDPA